MSTYKAALFDIDDTILKTWEPKWRQHKFVAKKYYDVELTDGVLRANWGKPFDALVEALYEGKGTSEERRENFTRHELEFPKEYEPHAQEMLEALHAAGIKLGLLTAMFMDGAMIDLKNLHVPLEYFDVLQGSEAVEFPKPDSRVFDPALAKLKEMGIEKSEVVYVGEAMSDLNAAKDAGLDFIAVTLGFATADDFHKAGAEHVCADLIEVQARILEA